MPTVRGAIVNPGDWTRIKNNLQILGAQRGFRKALEAEIDHEALRLAGAVRHGIRTQAPGGRPFRPLRPSTIHRKAKLGRFWTLIDEGHLISAITAIPSKDLVSFVGVPRTARGQGGRNLANIAAWLEFGTKKPNGSWRMKPLPFIRPVFEAERERIVANMQAAINRVIARFVR